MWSMLALYYVLFLYFFRNLDLTFFPYYFLHELDYGFFHSRTPPGTDGFEVLLQISRYPFNEQGALAVLIFHSVAFLLV